MVRQLSISWPAQFIASVSLHCTERDDRLVFQWLGCVGLNTSGCHFDQLFGVGEANNRGLSRVENVDSLIWDVKCLHKGWCEVYFLFHWLYLCVTWGGDDKLGDFHLQPLSWKITIEGLRVEKGSLTLHFLGSLSHFLINFVAVLWCHCLKLGPLLSGGMWTIVPHSFRKSKPYIPLILVYAYGFQGQGDLLQLFLSRWSCGLMSLTPEQEECFGLQQKLMSTSKQHS